MRRIPALSAMTIFEVVGQTGSFTRAAERLHLTQSAVSRQVRHLEAQIGEALVIRHHHRLELTPAGVELFGALQRAFHQVEVTLRGISQAGDRDRLRLNLPPTFAKRWFMPRLPKLLAARPGLSLSVGTALSDTMTERGLLDCAVRFGDGEWPTLHAVHLMTESHVAVCAPALLAGIGGSADNADLSKLTLLHVLAGEDRRYLTFAHWLGAAGLDGVDTAGGLEFDLLDLAIEAAVAGLGVTVADEAMVARELADGRLVKLRGLSVKGHQSYWLVTRPGEGERTAAFRDWLLAQLAIAG